MTIQINNFSDQIAAANFSEITKDKIREVRRTRNDDDQILIRSYLIHETTTDSDWGSLKWFNELQSLAYNKLKHWSGKFDYNFQSEAFYHEIKALEATARSLRRNKKFAKAKKAQKLADYVKTLYDGFKYPDWVDESDLFEYYIPNIK